jgi:hypothetical protein
MFNPTLSTRITIDGVEYSFTPHPAVPSLVWAQEGRHAIVYRIQDHHAAYGLKVFRPAFRHPGLIVTAESLWTYHELPGLEAPAADARPEPSARREHGLGAVRA